MKRLATYTLLAVVPLLLGSRAIVAEEATIESIEEVTAEKLISEYRQHYSSWVQKYQAASAGEQEALIREMPKAENIAKDLWEVIEANPKSPDTLAGLGFILGEIEKRQTRYRALTLLTENFLESEDAGSACAQLQSVPDRRVLGVLEAFMTESPHRTVQGTARFAYAKWLQSYRAKKSAAEIEACLEQVAEDYADVDHAYRGNLGDLAKANLFEIRNLQVGMKAPDIEGKDMDGVPFKLSDYRGKVVFLDYWAHW